MPPVVSAATFPLLVGTLGIHLQATSGKGGLTVDFANLTVEKP